MSIRARLALWYISVLGATMLIACLALYIALEAALEHNFDQMLRIRAAQVERELLSNLGDDEDLQPSEIQPDDLEPDALQDFAEPGVYVQVVSTEGSVLATSGTLLPVSEGLVENAQSQLDALETLAAGGQHFRTLYWPMMSHDRVIAIVQVAETLETLEQTMQETRTLMVGGGAALLGIAVLCGLLLTQRTLAPVSAVTEAARHIADTGRFDTRLAMGEPKDELTSLAATFDLMIGRIEQIIGQQRDFLADTSHELRNPLSIIRGNLDFVRRLSTDQASLEAMHEAELEAVRMSRLVDDLLLLAQADRHEFLAAQRVALSTLVETMAEQLRAAAGHPRVEIDVQAEIWVDADPDRIRQLIWNLVENALRYSPQDGRVRVTLRADDVEAVLAVQDSGPGVPAGQEERIFDRFYRADPSRTRSTGGAGLGLAIVKHIAESHGGRAEVKNGPGKGATFTVTLPLSEEPVAHKEPATASVAD
jgi:two-component system, OmpR family, sensor kinase